MTPFRDGKLAEEQFGDENQDICLDRYLLNTRIVNRLVSEKERGGRGVASKVSDLSNETLNVKSRCQVRIILEKLMKYSEN